MDSSRQSPIPENVVFYTDIEFEQQRDEDPTAPWVDIDIDLSAFRSQRASRVGSPSPSDFSSDSESKSSCSPGSSPGSSGSSIWISDESDTDSEEGEEEEEDEMESSFSGSSSHDSNTESTASCPMLAPPPLSVWQVARDQGVLNGRNQLVPVPPDTFEKVQDMEFKPLIYRAPVEEGAPSVHFCYLPGPQMLFLYVGEQFYNLTEQLEVANKKQEEKKQMILKSMKREHEGGENEPMVKRGRFERDE